MLNVRQTLSRPLYIHKKSLIRGKSKKYFYTTFSNLNRKHKEIPLYCMFWASDARMHFEIFRQSQASIT